MNSPQDVWVGRGSKVAYQWTGKTWVTQDIFDNREITAFWGDGSRAVWGVGAGGGYLGFFDGSRWLHSGPNIIASAIWGSGQGDIWATSSAQVVEWNGTIDPKPMFVASNVLNSIWGSSPTNVWAVGEKGLTVHFDGKNWTEASSGADNLNAIWGTQGNYWAVGEGGTILYFNGTTWSPATSPTTNTLRSVWGSDLNDLWAVGDGGVVLHYSNDQL